MESIEEKVAKVDALDSMAAALKRAQTILRRADENKNDQHRPVRIVGGNDLMVAKTVEAPIPAFKTRRYALVMDEAALSVNPVDLSTCDRAPSENSPHRHFTVIQFEVSENTGGIMKAAATPGQHAKEAQELCVEFAGQGVFSYLDTMLDTRVSDITNKMLTLRLEAEQGQAARIYVDVRNDDGKLVKQLGKFDNSQNGYKAARAFLLEAVAEYNMPSIDWVEDRALEKEVAGES